MAINEEKLKESISKASEILKNTAKEIESITFPGAKTIVFATEQLTDAYIAKLLKKVPAGYKKKFAKPEFDRLWAAESEPGKNANRLREDIFQHLQAREIDVTTY